MSENMGIFMLIACKILCGFRTFVRCMGMCHPTGLGCIKNPKYGCLCKITCKIAVQIVKSNPKYPRDPSCPSKLEPISSTPFLRPGPCFTKAHDMS